MLHVRLEKRLPGFTLNVDFTADNEVLALLGASGAGKTMTLQCIAGIVKPDRGRIVLDGRVLFDSERRINVPPQARGVGLLYQSYALFPNMTVRQNIRCGLLHAVPRKDHEAEVGRLLQSFCLEGLGGRYPRQLSGGQQQRVALARCLARKPSLLLLDEPFAALDSHLRWRLEQSLADTLASFGGTTLYVTHDREETRRLCHRVCVMRHGSSMPAVDVRRWYHAPATQSAALLAGFENVADATPEGGMAAIPQWGARWPCPLPTAAGVAFRAEHVRLRHAQEDLGIQCRILRTSNMETICVPISGSDALLRARPDARFAAGEPVWCCIPADHVAWLGQEG